MSENFASEIGPRRRPAVWFDWKSHIEHQTDYHVVLEKQLRDHGDPRDADAVNRIYNAACRFFLSAAFTFETAQQLDEWLRKKCEHLPSKGTVQTAADKALMMPLVNIADFLEEAIEEANGARKRETPLPAPELTTADSPQRWAKLFGFSVDTLKRRFKDGTIRHKKLTSKSYQIAVDDLPAVHQAKFRTGKNPPTK